MLRLFTCAMVLAFVSLTWAARPTTSNKKSTTKKSTTSSKSSSTKSSSKRSSSSAPVRKATTWRNRQAAPTPDRYRQIQEALAAKGYLRPEEATGVWNSASVDAMKRFQLEEKLASTGKINSLSLIALGLGPKHEAASPKQSPPQ